MKCPSLSLVVLYVLKSTFADVNIVMYDSSLLMFAWFVFFHLFTVNTLKVCFWLTTNGLVLAFYLVLQSVILYRDT